MKSIRKQTRFPDNSMASGDARRRKKGKNRNAEREDELDLPDYPLPPPPDSTVEASAPTDSDEFPSAPPPELFNIPTASSSLVDVGLRLRETAIREIMAPMITRSKVGSITDEKGVQIALHPFLWNEIFVRKLKIDFDEGMPELEETEQHLAYKVPYFRATAWVAIPPIAEGTELEIGWINVCNEFVCVNSYGDDGLTSWEIPELNNQKYQMINDSNGQNFPWYGRSTKIVGPHAGHFKSQYNMSYIIKTNVNWVIPVDGYTEKASLTFVCVNHKFTSYLVAKRHGTNEYLTLRTIKWSYEVAIDIDPKKPLESRAEFIGPCEQIEPVVVDETKSLKLQKNIFKGPTVNACQIFLWRPKNADPEVIFARDIDMENYVSETKDMTSDLYSIHNKKNFLLKQKKRMKQMKIWEDE